MASASTFQKNCNFFFIAGTVGIQEKDILKETNQDSQSSIPREFEEQSQDRVEEQNEARAKKQTHDKLEEQTQAVIEEPSIQEKCAVVNVDPPL